MEVCRLCLDLATKSDMKTLEGMYMDATQIVLPEVNTSVSCSPLVCSQCTCSLDELYTFKVSVMETEHQIKEKIGGDKCQLQLKEVITGVKIDEKDADRGKSKDRMCRACLCAIEAETFTVLKPTQSDAYLSSMLLMCLPEMELELTLDPVMCEQCLCNLQKLYHFKSSCLDVEERLKNYCQQHSTTSSSQINLHSVLEEDAAEPKSNNYFAVKSEPIDSSVSDYKSEEDDADVSMSDNSKDIGYTVVNVKKEDQELLKEEDDTEDDSMGDDADNISNEKLKELKQEELKIEDVDGDESKKKRLASGRKKTILKNTGSQHLKCRLCEYTTKRASNMRRHTEVRHLQTALPVLKCDSCDYTTRIKDNLRGHVRNVHSSSRSIIKCDFCEFTTKRQSNMKAHVERKHVQNELPLLECESCDYKTRIKDNLREHLRNVHSKKSIIKCDHCEFTTKHLSNMHRHVEVWHFQNELPLLKCESCDYMTRIKNNLRRHVTNIHSSESIIACKHCDYTTKYGSNMRSHMSSAHFKGPIIKCEHCEYSTKRIYNLKRHIEIRHLQK